MKYALVIAGQVVQECTYEDIDLAIYSKASNYQRLHVFSRIEDDEPWEYIYTVWKGSKTPSFPKE